jgi:hypothetical protein
MRASVGALAAEYARLSAELMDMEQRMAAVRTETEARSLDERMASHRAALAHLEREQRAKEDAERQAAAAAAAQAARERLSGHSRALADAHDAKLRALETAEAHMAAMVEAVNIALAQEAAERAAATALAAELNVDTTPLQFSGDDTKRRLTGGIRAYLAQISAFRNRRFGDMALAIDADVRAGEGWAQRDERHTGWSVETLLAHADGSKVAA